MTGQITYVVKLRIRFRIAVRVGDRADASYVQLRDVHALACPYTVI